jgi:hypothetical protein
MILPLAWIVCGLWFHASARKVGARPWPWIGVMIGVSLAVAVVLAIPLGLLLDAIQPDLRTASSASREHFDFINQATRIGVGVVSIASIIPLRAFLMKRVPFREHPAGSTPAS